MDALKNLQESWRKGNFLCAGLDLAEEKLPASLLPGKSRFERLATFAGQIIEATSEIAAAYKPNLGFFLQYGPEGLQLLEDVVAQVREKAPKAILILDGKFGDIGNTNAAYARYAYGKLGVDSVTLNPYVGGQALKEFLQYEGKLPFVLCRTSNEGADELQGLTITNSMGDNLSDKVASGIASWKTASPIGLVAGATDPFAILNIRSRAPESTILLPGIGAQAGDLVGAAQAAANEEKVGVIFNVSRSMLYASNGSDFAEAAYVYAVETNRQFAQAISERENFGYLNSEI